MSNPERMSGADVTKPDEGKVVVDPAYLESFTLTEVGAKPSAESADAQIAANMMRAAEKFRHDIDEVQAVKSLNPLARYQKLMDLLYGRHVGDLKGLHGKELAAKLVEQNMERGEAINEVLKLEWHEAGEKAKRALKAAANGIAWGLKQTLGLVPKVLKGVGKLVEWSAKLGVGAAAAGATVATSPVWMTVGAVETASMVVRNQVNPGKDVKSNIPLAGGLIDAAAAKVNGGVDRVFRAGGALVHRLAQGLEGAQLSERRAKQRAIDAQLELPLGAGAAEPAADVKDLRSDQDAADTLIDQVPDEDLRDLEAGEEESLMQEVRKFNKAGSNWAYVEDLFLRIQANAPEDAGEMEELKDDFEGWAGVAYSGDFKLEEWVKKFLSDELGHEPTEEELDAIKRVRDDELEDEDNHPGYAQRLAATQQKAAA